MKYFKPTIKFLAIFGAAGALFLDAPQLQQSYFNYRVNRNVLKLVKPTNHNTGGTGFVVKAPSGSVYTMTNAHVCELHDNGYMHAISPGKVNRYYSLKIKAVSKDTDLCLLEPAPGFSGISRADSSYIGERVRAVGHPALLPLSDSSGVLSNFEDVEILYKTNISEADCTGPGFRYISTIGSMLDAIFGVQSLCFRTIAAASTNAITFPGSSGSPVVNVFGNLVGVVFAGHRMTNYGYIIPISEVNKFLEIY